MEPIDPPQEIAEVKTGCSANNIGCEEQPRSWKGGEYDDLVAEGLEGGVIGKPSPPIKEKRTI